MLSGSSYRGAIGSAKGRSFVDSSPAPSISISATSAVTAVSGRDLPGGWGHNHATPIADETEGRRDQRSHPVTPSPTIGRRRSPINPAVRLRRAGPARHAAMTAVSDSCQITPTDTDQRRRRDVRRTACFLSRDYHRSPGTTPQKNLQAGGRRLERARSRVGGWPRYAARPPLARDESGPAPVQHHLLFHAPDDTSDSRFQAVSARPRGSRWAHLGSNQGPLACEASALPLSYAPESA